MAKLLLLPDGPVYFVNAHIDLRSEEKRKVTVLHEVMGKKYTTIDIIPEFEITDTFYVKEQY